MKAKKTKIGSIQARVVRTNGQIENLGTIYNSKVGLINKLIRKIKLWLQLLQM